MLTSTLGNKVKKNIVQYIVPFQFEVELNYTFSFLEHDPEWTHMRYSYLFSDVIESGFWGCFLLVIFLGVAF